MASPVLVTGAHGFIGRHVCRTLATRGFEVRALGHGAWSEAEVSGWGISRWLEADITFESLAQAAGGESLDALIHCAGSGSVSYSYNAPFEDYQRSVSTVATVLEFVRNVGAHGPRVVMTSSAAVYGDQGDVDLNETATRSPVSPYGFHKLAAEGLCDSYARFFGVKVSVVRLFSVYGEGLRKQLLWDGLNKLGRGDAHFFGTGHELRDWVHVDDAAQLLCTAACAPQANFEIYNGGNQKATTREVLSQLASALGTGVGPSFNGQTHTGNPRRLTSDSGHARRQLGWKPRITLEEGLTRYAAWFNDGCLDRPPA
jgi:UDP-glucose 4-epimerase